MDKKLELLAKRGIDLGLKNILIMSSGDNLVAMHTEKMTIRDMFSLAVKFFLSAIDSQVGVEGLPDTEKEKFKELAINFQKIIQIHNDKFKS